MNVSTESAEKKLTSFINKFDAKHRQLIRKVRKELRKRFPTANELAYERPSDCIVSIAAAASGVGLCFIHGASLPDPNRMLLGEGNQTRVIRLESASRLNRLEVKALLAAAVAQSKVPLSTSGSGKLIIRSVSKKQRPRRKKK